MASLPIPQLEWPEETKRKRNSVKNWTPPAPQPVEDPKLATELVAFIRSSASEPTRDAAVILSHLRGLLRATDDESQPRPTEDPDEMVLWLCMEALKLGVSAELWHFIWSLAYHSAMLEHGLYSATVLLAGSDPKIKSELVVAAQVIATEFASDPTKLIKGQEGEALARLSQQWIEQGSLTDLWFGLRGFHPSMVRGEISILGIMADVDASVFMRLLDRFTDPYCALTVLEGESGALWSFERWQTLVGIAPIAFDANGEWNRSVILPLLLSLGLDKLSDGSRLVSARSSDTDVAAMTAQVHGLIDRIVATMVQRADSDPCSWRWTAWLMRRAIMGVANQNPPYPTDVRVSGYAEFKLIEALSKAVGGEEWPGSLAVPTEPWEPWCYRCVGVVNALAWSLPVQRTKAFLDEWRLDPEDWSLQKGDDLRAHAQLLVGFGKRADALGARYLALPLVEDGVPEANWCELWREASTIREIIEFGDDDISALGQSSRLEAAGLMRLCFALGLMMLDHLISPFRALTYDRTAAVVRLTAMLADGVHEMKAIDYFERSYWDEALRHLAIRKAVYLSPGAKLHVGELDLAVTASSLPSLADLISQLDGNVEELLAFIDAALRNLVDRATLSQAIVDAGIDLGMATDVAARLLTIDPRKAGFSEAQLATARGLLQ